MNKIAVAIVVALFVACASGCTTGNPTTQAWNGEIFSNNFQASWFPKPVSEYDLMRDRTVLDSVKQLLGMAPDTWDIPNPAMFESLYASKSRLVLYKEFEKVVDQNNEIDKILISKINECKSSATKAIFPVGIYFNSKNKPGMIFIRDPMFALFHKEEFVFNGKEGDTVYRNESMNVEVRSGFYRCPYMAFEDEQMSKATLFWPAEFERTSDKLPAVFVEQKIGGVIFPPDERVIINKRPAIKVYIEDPCGNRLSELEPSMPYYTINIVRDGMLPGDGLPCYKIRQENVKVVSDVMSEDEGPYAYFFYDNYNPIWELHFYAPGENYKKGGDVRGP